MGSLTATEIHRWIFVILLGFCIGCILLANTSKKTPTLQGKRQHNTSFSLEDTVYSEEFPIANELISIDEAHSKDVLRTKHVLYWSPFWQAKDYFYGYGFDPFKSCEYKNCYATDNRTFVPLEKFDAFLFHASTYDKRRHGLPSRRYPHQRYVYVNVEAPANLCPNLRPFASFFNWTMSYRYDSDLVRRHGYLIYNATGYEMPTVEDVKKKRKLAAWFVSHCRTSSRREALKAIQRYVPVDIYGGCGNLTCKKKGMTSSLGCYDVLERDYKFYFSFENAVCKDYSSEKMYSVLLRDVVPVVYGFGDYGLSAPPNSVINVANFGSLKELADYLKFLDENPEEYLKYFQWKKNYKIDVLPTLSACQLCKKLHQPLGQSIYHDLNAWWWGPNKSMCKEHKELPKIVRDLL